jgi:TRAP-type C4-dicarboxylate transport system permease small subunit
VFLIGVAWYGMEYVMSSMATDLRAPVLNWSVWPFQLAIPVGFASAAVRYLIYAAYPAARPIPPEFQE